MIFFRSAKKRHFFPNNIFVLNKLAGSIKLVKIDLKRIVVVPEGRLDK